MDQHGEDCSVKVAVHARPLIGDEKLQGCKDCVAVVPGKPQVLVCLLLARSLDLEAFLLRFGLSVGWNVCVLCFSSLHIFVFWSPFR
jgi:hypothetical protein